MRRPRELNDLPYAPYLRRHDGSLEPGGMYDSVQLRELELTDVDASGVRFLESALTATTISGGSLRAARLSDVWLQSVRLVGTTLAQTQWTDVEMVAGSLAGVQMYAAELRQVSLFGCKLDSVNLRGANLTGVSFIDCVLTEVDLGEATLSDVSFPGSRIERLRLAKAQLSAVDLTEAASVELVDGIDALRGAAITRGQLLDLAEWFAVSAGVVLRD